MANSFKRGKMYQTVHSYHIWNLFNILTKIYSKFCIFLYIFSHFTTHSAYFSTFSNTLTNSHIFIRHIFTTNTYYYFTKTYNFICKDTGASYILYRFYFLRRIALGPRHLAVIIKLITRWRNMRICRQL